MPMPKTRIKPALTEEEIALRAQNKALAKKVVILLVIACALLVGLNVLSGIDFSPLMQSILGTPEKPNIKFETPDFEENILADKSYLKKQRLMAYKVGGQMTLINEEDYAQYDPAVNRMHTYFHAAIHGFLDTYNACFTEAYHEENDGPRTERFTMQRIYDIEVELIAQTKDPENERRNRSYFRVEYKIQKNNGTFRDDMGSDCSRAQIFEVTWDPIEKDAGIDALWDYGTFPGIPNA